MPLPVRIPKPPPKAKVPLHYPKTWKQNNRFIRPGLTPSDRNEYRERIITTKKEPLWSRMMGLFNMYICAGFAAYALFFVDWGTKHHVFQGIRSEVDNWWAEYWYINSYQRRRLMEERARMDERLRAKERELDERAARRRASGSVGGIEIG